MSEVPLYRDYPKLCTLDVYIKYENARKAAGVGQQQREKSTRGASPCTPGHHLSSIQGLIYIVE